MKRFTVPSVLLLTLCLLAGPALAASAPQAERTSQVDVNKASIQELATVPYIGEKRAAEIVARRQAKPFASLEELIEVNGIGEKTLEKIRPYLKADASSK